MIRLSMRSSVCQAVWLFLCLRFMAASQPPTKLSPRIVKTKYGQLRGVIIDLVPSSSAYAEFHQNQLYQPASGGNHSKPSLPNETAQLNKFLINEHSAPQASSFTRPDASPEKIQIEAFLGVSYAQPPVNDRRFLPPVSPAHWRGIKLADQLGPVCIQKLPKELQKPSDQGGEYNVFRSNQTGEQPADQADDPEQSSFHRLANFLRNQSEDCLHLNIYVPNFNHQNKGKFFSLAAQWLLIRQLLKRLQNSSKFSRKFSGLNFKLECARKCTTNKIIANESFFIILFAELNSAADDCYVEETLRGVY